MQKQIHASSIEVGLGFQIGWKLGIQTVWVIISARYVKNPNGLSAKITDCGETKHEKSPNLNRPACPLLSAETLQYFTVNMPTLFLRAVFSKFFGRRCLVGGLVSAPAHPLPPPKNVSTSGLKKWQDSQIHILP